MTFVRATVTMRRPAASRPACATLVVAGAPLLADPSGALWYEEARALIVADLHLEKGSAFAARGALLPPWDTAATLARLTSVILRYNPRLVVALGDSFHDARAGERMSAQDRGALAQLMSGRDWLWIAGNHDPAIPQGLGELCAGATLGALSLRHEPTPGRARGELAGHLHPAARVVSLSGSARRRCFAADSERCVLPAFGAYAGGLNVRDSAFDGLFGHGDGALRLHLLGRERVYSVDPARCVGD